jgi:hypothetical protein
MKVECFSILKGVRIGCLISMFRGNISLFSKTWWLGGMIGYQRLRIGVENAGERSWHAWRRVAHELWPVDIDSNSVIMIFHRAKKQTIALRGHLETPASFISMHRSVGCKAHSTVMPSPAAAHTHTRPRSMNRAGLGILEF